MEKQITFSEQVAAWDKGEYALYPHCNDFYDWFCQDKSLESRAKKLKGLAKKLVLKMNLNPDSVYVFFKNNCPLSGPLYDSLSICDIKRREVICWATPKSGHTNQAEVAFWDSERKWKEFQAPTFTNLLSQL